MGRRCHRRARRHATPGCSQDAAQANRRPAAAADDASAGGGVTDGGGITGTRTGTDTSTRTGIGSGIRAAQSATATLSPKDHEFRPAACAAQGYDLQPSATGAAYGTGPR